MAQYSDLPIHPRRTRLPTGHRIHRPHCQGLTDVTGQAVLADDFEWQLAPFSPAVVGSTPAGNDLYVSPTPVISVTFNQKMDRPDVEKTCCC